jgi:hypothetical protein
MKKLVALIVIVLIALSGCKYTLTPDAAFLDSQLIVRPGIDDLGKMKVREFIDKLATVAKPDGTAAELKIWEQTDNGYILTAKIAAEFEMEFIWDKAKGITLLTGADVNGEVIPGLQLLMVLASSPKVKATTKSTGEAAKTAPPIDTKPEPVTLAQKSESPASTQATRIVNAVTLQSFECGDTCQLQYADASGQSHSAICSDSKLCDAWADESKKFVPLIGAKADLVVGKKFVPEGNVTIDSIEEVRLLGGK